MSRLARSRAGRAFVAGALAVVALASCTRTNDGTPSPAGPERTSTGAGTGSSASPAPSQPPVTPAHFTDCTHRLASYATPLALNGKLRAACATIRVPVDYRDPTGTTLPMAVVRIRDVDATTHRPLLINPGGPGASGVGFALAFAGQLPATVLRHYDIIGFDPRGTGASDPVHCLTNAQLDAYTAASPDISTPAGVTELRHIDTTFSRRCASRYGSALGSLNTVNTARDMDVLRRTLGARRIGYLGFSYGTTLGSIYAHLFPRHVRAMVLDGAVDPNRSPVAAAQLQLRGFERGFGQFAAWCQATMPCKLIGDPTSTVIELFASTLHDPMRTTDTARPLTASLAATGVIQAMYSRGSWPALATALIEAHDGSGTGLLQLADVYNDRRSDGGYSSNIIEANLAVDCNDSPAEPGVAQDRGITARWQRQYPVFAVPFAAELYSCTGWVPAHTVPPKPTAPTDTKVLVIGNSNDPVTPLQGAQDLTTAMGNAELLTWHGIFGHTSYLRGSSCIDNAVNRYLVSLTLPPSGTTCPQ